MAKEVKKNMKKIPKLFVILIAVCAILFGCFYKKTNVFAENGSGDRCLKLDFRDNGFPAAVVINTFVWNSEDDEFHTTDGNYTIVILAGKRGDDFPQLSTPGGFRDQENVSVDTSPNLDQDPLVDGDEYKITITLTNYGAASGCEFLGGIELTPGPEPETNIIEHPTITLDISGDELEYHYVASKPEEDDVARFKIGINNRVERGDGTFAGASSNGLIPFRFGNVTFKDNIEPPHATGARTTNPITDYEYAYDGSGYVEFCVNGGAADEYTKIEINGVDYSDQAPHTKVEVFEHIIGRASQFCITGVPHADNYDIVVEGERLPLDKQVTGFGWSYLSADRSLDVTEENEGAFAHGRIEFVKVDYTDIDDTHYEFDNVSSYNNTRYHGTGEIYEWVDGQKDYIEEDRRTAWGEALIPYGAELTIRVVPDAGYQLTSFTTSPNGFQATDEPGVYTIVVNQENLYSEDFDKFELSATFTEIGSEVQATTDAVRGGTIQTDQAIDNGSIKLAVSDANASEDSQTAFVDKASEQGYTVSDILDISLYNSIYKGGKKDNNGNYLSWDTELNNLDNKANIELELQENMDGKEVALVHEIHDDEAVRYEFVDINYNSETNTITFEEDSFSNFAIVVKESNEEPQEPEENQAVIIYNTRSSDHIDDVIINKGEKAPIPRDPIHEDGFEFEGWYTTEGLNEEYDFNLVVDVDRLELFAKWAEPENPEPSEEPERDTLYVVKDDNDNEVSFMEEEGHTYYFEMIDYLSFTKEEVMAMAGITAEQYDKIFGGIKKQAEKKGTFLFFYDISVYELVTPDPEDPEDDGRRDIHEGPFTIKIKMTDELAKYNDFKMYYVNEEFNLDNKAIKFSVSKDGKYLVGELPHLSPYVLVGNNVSSSSNTNPPTGDNISTWVGILVISALGLSLGIFVTTKLKKSKVK